jgi:hypothetical protein
MLEDRRKRLAEIESDRDVLMERYAEMVPAALDTPAPEVGHRLYKMLQLTVVLNTDRSQEVSGALRDQFCESETLPR